MSSILYLYYIITKVLKCLYSLFIFYICNLNIFHIGNMNCMIQSYVETRKTLRFLCLVYKISSKHRSDNCRCCVTLNSKQQPSVLTAVHHLLSPQPHNTKVRSANADASSREEKRHTKVRHRHVRFAIHQELSRLHGSEGDDSLREKLDRLRPGAVLDHRVLLQPANHEQFAYLFRTIRQIFSRCDTRGLELINNEVRGQAADRRAT